MPYVHPPFLFGKIWLVLSAAKAAHNAPDSLKNGEKRNERRENNKCFVVHVNA